MKHISTEELNEMAEKSKTSPDIAECLLGDFQSFIKEFVVKTKLYIPGLEYDDMVQIANLSFFKAIQTYDRTRGEFLMYAKVNMRSDLLAELNHQRNLKNKTLNYSFSLDKPLETEEAANFHTVVSTSDIDNTMGGYRSVEHEFFLGEAIQELKDKMQYILTDREQKVFYLRMEGKSYVEVAIELGLSTKSVDNAYFSGKRKMKKALLSKGKPKTVVKVRKIRADVGVPKQLPLLSDRQKTVYDLRQSGLTYEEIGIKLGITRPNAYATYRKAHEKLEKEKQKLKNRTA